MEIGTKNELGTATGISGRSKRLRGDCIIPLIDIPKALNVRMRKLNMELCEMTFGEWQMTFMSKLQARKIILTVKVNINDLGIWGKSLH